MDEFNSQTRWFLVWNVVKSSKQVIADSASAFSRLLLLLSICMQAKYDWRMTNTVIRPSLPATPSVASLVQIFLLLLLIANCNCDPLCGDCVRHLSYAPCARQMPQPQQRNFTFSAMRGHTVTQRQLREWLVIWVAASCSGRCCCCYLLPVARSPVCLVTCCPNAWLPGLHANNFRSAGNEWNENVSNASGNNHWHKGNDGLKIAG